MIPAQSYTVNWEIITVFIYGSRKLIYIHCSSKTTHLIEFNQNKHETGFLKENKLHIKQKLAVLIKHLPGKRDRMSV